MFKLDNSQAVKMLMEVCNDGRIIVHIFLPSFYSPYLDQKKKVTVTNTEENHKYTQNNRLDL